MFEHIIHNLNTRIWDLASFLSVQEFAFLSHFQKLRSVQQFRITFFFWEQWKWARTWQTRKDLHNVGKYHVKFTNENIESGAP